MSVHLSAGLQKPDAQIIEITGRVNPDGKTFVANELAALSNTFDLCVPPRYPRAARAPFLLRPPKTRNHHARTEYPNRDAYNELIKLMPGFTTLF